MNKITVIVTALTLASAIFAGPIEDEYNRTRDEIEKMRETPEMKKEQLQRTLNRSLQRALLRYYNLPDYDKAELAEGSYERSEVDPYTFYYKYKDYVGYFTYSVDPEKYLAVPVSEKILLKPSAKNPDTRGN